MEYFKNNNVNSQISIQSEDKKMEYINIINKIKCYKKI